VPDQRPGCGPGAADELVEQLDCKQEEAGAAGAAREPVELRAGAGHDTLSLRPEFVKLDISLTRGIGTAASRRALASALTAFRG